MKKMQTLLLVFLITSSVWGQDKSETFVKPPIDTSVFDKWPSVRNPVISNNGDYFSYTIYNQPVGSSTLVLRSIRGKWIMEFPGVSRASFTDDSRKALFTKPKDSLCVLTLGSSSAEYTSEVSSFKLFKHSNTEWLVYQSSTQEKELVLSNLATGRSLSFTAVVEYLLTRDGSNLVLKTQQKKPESGQILSWVSISEGKPRIIWEGSGSGNLTLDEAGTQLAFAVQDTVRKEKSIWHYRVGKNRGELLVNDRSAGVEEGFKVESIIRFSKDGGRLFIKLKEPDFPTPKEDAVKVDVWSYTDPKLQSEQLNELSANPFNLLAEGRPQVFSAVINLGNRDVMRLQHKNEEIRLLGKETIDDVAIVSKTRAGGGSEWNWNPTSRPSFYLISTLTGERKKISVNHPYTLSPNGKYLVGTDSFVNGKSNDLLSYELASGQIRNMTSDLPVPMDESEVWATNVLRHRGLRVVAWLPGDEAVIIHDKYDLWQIDPKGRKRPIDLTNSFGRKNNIVFRVSGLQELYGKTISQKEQLLLAATDLQNRDNGFYMIDLARRGDPEILTMGPYNYDEFFDIFKPRKARDAEVYVVKRETATESPNYLWTSDFKIFYSLTGVYPEKAYNWLTSELVMFKTLDGRSEQGALYKPENIDPNKKHPVIIHYYEEKVDRINAYHRPEPIADELNIPWFVSRGYLVFTPDIHYEVGNTGESILNSVVGAAKQLAALPWADAKRIGIQGHSFGGFETMYLVTHTDLFAAAMASSGFGDLVSGSGAVMFSGGAPFQRYWAEVGQGRLGATLWENPDRYIKNSPIFLADKVTTPLFMMNNKKDGIVDFSQGVEFFTALRRLGKRAWMLQYDDEVHSVYNKKAQIDYTTRMTQFFDHYLKGAPAPKWMTRGIPARMKGIEDGLELDHEIKTPGAGLLIEEKSESRKSQDRKKD